MRRMWIGIGLLSGSWLLGIGLFHAPVGWAWGILLALGVGLLWNAPVVVPGRAASVTAIVLLLPLSVTVPWPYTGLPLLMGAGLILCTLPIPRQWPQRLGTAMILAGSVLTVQALALQLYIAQTARSHDLPVALAQMLGQLARLLGIDACVDGRDLCLFTLRQVLRLGLTWELLLDPVSLLFLVGGLTFLVFRVVRLRDLGVAMIRFSLCSLAWWPIRAGLCIALVMQRSLRTPYDSPLDVMPMLLHPATPLALLLGPLLLVFRFVQVSAYVPPVRGHIKPLLGIVLTVQVLFSTFLVTTGLFLDPPGLRKSGRVLVDAFHGSLRPTDQPYDTERYGPESASDYACVYDYLSRFYDLQRGETQLTAAALDKCDVLLLAAPTLRLDPNELAVIEQFVRQGGGLMLIGEQANAFNTSTCLNDVARVFGFVFRDDCLLGLDAAATHTYRPSVVPHPAVQQVPALTLGGGCSIEPGLTRGRAAIRSLGRKSLPADYHTGRFHPQTEDHPNMRYGAFVQLWTQHWGAGRIVAFGDAGLFSNATAFAPGSAELMLGIVEWLNHSNTRVHISPWLLAVGCALGCLALVHLAYCRHLWSFFIAFGFVGWASGLVATRTIQQSTIPALESLRPLTRVVLDRRVCRADLRHGDPAGVNPDGFTLFTRWIQRLGYVTGQYQGPQVFTGDLLVFCHPTETVSDRFRQALADHVAQGGKVLILDSPDNPDSSANGLLTPFAVGLDKHVHLSGELRRQAGDTAIPIAAAHSVQGGTPWAWIDNAPVATRIRYGRGMVTVVGFGSRFANRNMGGDDRVPDDALRAVFDLEFDLLRSTVEIHRD